MGQVGGQDRRDKSGYRQAPEAYEGSCKWTAIFIGWCGVVFLSRGGLGDLVAMAIVVWHAVRVRQGEAGSQGLRGPDPASARPS